MSHRRHGRINHHNPRPGKDPGDVPSPRRPPPPARSAEGKADLAAPIGRLVAIPLLLAALVTAGSPGWGSYTIRRGDTLEAIAARYGTTVSRLVEVNRLPGNGNLIYAGESLRVPAAQAGLGQPHRHDQAQAPRRGRRQPDQDRQNVRRAPGRHRPGQPPAVVVGRAARRHARRTGDAQGRPTPRRGAARTRSPAAPTPRRSCAAAARNRAILANRSVPSRAAMRALIVTTAKQQGVDPALALAISWQESGFNMRAVSVANAIGAMQVIPSTGDWISSVVGRRLDLLKPRDNVTAGVVLLRILTRSASQRTRGRGLLPGPEVRPRARDVPRHQAVRRQHPGPEEAVRGSLAPDRRARRCRGRQRAGRRLAGWTRRFRTPWSGACSTVVTTSSRGWRAAAWPPSTSPWTAGSTARSRSR